MPDETGEVDAGARGVDDVAVPGVVGPRPRHRVVEEVARDVLDVGEEVRDVAAGRVGHGVEREAAVADEHRGHAVQDVGIDVRVPEHLRIGVAVRVDESRCDDRARRVDLGGAVDREVGADLDDLVTAHAHVGPLRRGTGAVDDVATADQDLTVGHVRPPPLGWHDDRSCPTLQNESRQVVTPTASPKSSTGLAMQASGIEFQMFSADSSAVRKLPSRTASAMPATPG